MQAVRVSVTSELSGPVGETQVINRPAVGAVSSVLFPNVPLGSVTVTALFLNGEGTELGSDTQTINLTVGVPQVVTLRFTPPTPVTFKEYLVAGNNSELLVFDINLQTGSLTRVQTVQFPENSLPFSVDIRSDGMLYVTFNILGKLIHFSINPTNGALTTRTELDRPVPEGGALTPDGRFYYHCQPDLGTPGAIRIYSLDPVTGTPGEGDISPFIILGADRPQRIFIHPNGRFLYAAERNSGTTNGVFYAFSINQTNGELTEIGGPVSISSQRAFAFAVSPDQNTLYVTGNSSQIDAFGINQTTGELTRVVTPFPAAQDTNLGEMVVDSERNILYVCGFNFGKIEAYNLDASGRVTTPLAGSPYDVGTLGTLTLSRDPSGDYLLATSTGTTDTFGSVASFRINADGTLTPAPGSPFEAGRGTFDHDTVQFETTP